MSSAIGRSRNTSDRSKSSATHAQVEVDSSPRHNAQQARLSDMTFVSHLSNPSPSTFLDKLKYKATGETPPVIPLANEHQGKAKTLVLCFDGTGDQFDSDNSNVVEFFSLLKKGDRTRQLVYYQSGIGTYSDPRIVTPMASKLSKLLDEAVAWNLHSHVMGGYEFLMQNYNEGDRICIFGFSRGAYTARSLAGMIHKVGILPKCNMQQIPFAYKMFVRDDDWGWDQSRAFKKAFAIDAGIEFVGVWDTVSSVGIFPKTLPFAKTNNWVRTFRHAVSLDEHRAKFKANLWHRHKKVHGEVDEEEENEEKDEASENGNVTGHYGRQYADVEEVWFAGCHTDVGGGSVTNDVKHNLAHIPLRWMVRECFKANTGILFKTEELGAIGIDPASLWPEVLPRPEARSAKGRELASVPKKSLFSFLKSTAKEKGIGYNKSRKSLGRIVHPHGNLIADGVTEEDLELEDALQPSHDQLLIKLAWWILEIIPFTYRYQHDESDKWLSSLRINLGRARRVPRWRQEGCVKVHRSVKMRMEAEGNKKAGLKKYVPKAKLDLDKVIWVD